MPEQNNGDAVLNLLFSYTVPSRNLHKTYYWMKASSPISCFIVSTEEPRNHISPSAINPTKYMPVFMTATGAHCVADSRTYTGFVPRRHTHNTHAHAHSLSSPTPGFVCMALLIITVHCCTLSSVECGR